MHLTGTYPADLILSIEQDNEAFFYSHTIDNQAHNNSCYWTAPENKKLLNTTYHWEIYDDDDGSSNDFIDSGSFNPILNAINGKITIQGSRQSQLVLHYTIAP